MHQLPVLLVIVMSFGMSACAADGSTPAASPASVPSTTVGVSGESSPLLTWGRPCVSAMTPLECESVDLAEETFDASMTVGQLLIEGDCSYVRYPNGSLGPVVLPFGAMWTAASGSVEFVDGNVVAAGEWFQGEPAGDWRPTEQELDRLGPAVADRLEVCLNRPDSVDSVAVISPSGHVMRIDPPKP